MAYALAAHVSRRQSTVMELGQLVGLSATGLTARRENIGFARAYI